jgi:hypothetical protein
MQTDAITESDYLARESANQGVCVVCQSWAGDVDPGAAAVGCPRCGQPGVHGVEQALLLGYLRIRR